MTGEVGKLYAQALFELSTENNELDKVYNELNGYSDIFEQNPDLIKLLSAPTVSLDEKLEIVNKIFDDCGNVYSFLCILIEKGRITKLLSVRNEFNKLYNEKNNIAEMTVTTSVALKAELREKLLLKLEAKSGKKVKLTEKVDKDIIGGIIVRYGNTIMDNSIKGKLEAVAQELRA